MIDYTARESLLANRKNSGTPLDSSDAQLKANHKQYEARKKIEQLLEERRLNSEFDAYDSFDLDD